ncbi:MAG: TetR/AcrR family transcriptional regulator, partial [Brachybacterium sp.]
TDGFDRSSVDAIAALAGVSKRTVYDYFGDKQTLLRAVFDGLGQSLLATIRSTLDDTLGDVAAADQLEPALIDFSMRIANDWLDSADYATLQGLARTDSERLPSSKDSPLSDEPEEAIGARFATLADAGLLEVPDARLAADHYIGLTFAATINRLGTANAAADSRVQPLIVAGVRAFLRAYRVG